MTNRFSVLGSSRCEFLSLLDLKDGFHSLRLSEYSKRYCGILPYFGSAFIFISKNSYGIKYISINLAIIYKCDFRLFAN